MKPSLLTSVLFLASLFFLGCVLTPSQDIEIPPEPTSYKMPFDSDYWTVSTSKDPDSVQLSSADYEIAEKASFSISGCTEVRAYKVLFNEDLSNNPTDVVGAIITIEEFRASPSISHENSFFLQFPNFSITVTPKEEIVDQSFTFVRNEEGVIELLEDTEAITFTYSTQADENEIEINLKAESPGDCQGSAKWVISEVEILRLLEDA